jgi:hypothetical protein
MKGPWNPLSRGPPNQIKRSPQPLDSYLCTVFCLMSLGTTPAHCTPPPPPGVGQAAAGTIPTNQDGQRHHQRVLPPPPPLLPSSPSPGADDGRLGEVQERTPAPRLLCNRGRRPDYYSQLRRLHGSRHQRRCPHLPLHHKMLPPQQ